MTITENLNGKNFLITGGTGFIGKCLLEKLFRSVPNIGNVYLLLRSKKGKTPEERLSTFFDDPLFNNLKEIFPEFAKKVVLIDGDMQKPKLGISGENWRILIDNVNVIYHSAASVRFDVPLIDAILTNVRSTRDLAELALEAKHLDVFIHISSTYGNSDKDVVEERLYPCHGDWREVIRLAEEGDRTIVQYLAQKYIHPLPNTYLYAKAVTEHVVNDLCRGKIPAVIVRPSIVTNAVVDPIPGWTDNLNGPIGLLFAASTGIERVALCNEKVCLDAIPVDAAVNFLILATVNSLKNPNREKINVFNNSKHYNYKLDFAAMKKFGEVVVSKGPINEMIWFPDGVYVTSELLYRFLAILYHILPAILIDGLLRISGKQSRLFQIQKKIFVAQLVLKPFMMKFWTFKNEKAMALEKMLTEEEVPIFGYIEKIKLIYTNPMEYLENSCIGIQKYLFKQEVNFEENKKLWKRRLVLSIITRILFYVFLIWFVLRNDIHGVLYKRLENYFSSL